MKRNRGCIRPFIIIIFAILILYFMVGDGKEKVAKMIYPIKYAEYVGKYAEEYNLDKYLVYSVIKVESNFEPDATSTVGAKGLMQLMDKTAEECNKKEGFGYNIPQDLYEPQKNIRMGCYYLRSLLNTYKNVELAVTAYNAGTGNVRKWLKDENLSDGDGGLTTIPYFETEQYVKKVLKAYDRYTKIYKEGRI